MLRTRRLAVLAVAWVAPAAWIALALFSGPSDGTTISPPTVFSSAARWSGTVEVVRAYGGTPLRPGDRILDIDGHSLEEWVSADQSVDRAVGDTLTYSIRRPGQDLDRLKAVEVELMPYPLTAALAANLPTAMLCGGLVAAGSFIYWQRPGEPLSLALLSLCVTVPGALTADALGIGAIDLAGSRGLWPQVGGELLYTVALGSLLTTALTFPWTRAWLRGHPTRYLLPYALPLAGYAVWVLASAVWVEPGLARLQAVADVSSPAWAITVPAVAAALVHGYARAPSREDRVAVRLVLFGVVAVLLVRLVLGDLPQLLLGRPLVPWTLQALLLTPTMLLCMLAAVLRYRLYEIDAVVSRSLLQVILATLLGLAFLAVVGVVGMTAGGSFASMLAGGVVALVLLPLALALRRVTSRVLYGDREFPYRVVSELRQLGPAAAPGDTLHDMLGLLARSLRLSYASVEIHGRSPEDRVRARFGTPRGTPTSVVLDIAGTPIGQLDLEVTPTREPFGPRDRRLLEDVGSQVGAMVQAVLTSRTLQLSREGLVAAREEERRRVRRDLHDGLGPSLAAMAMKLEVARELIGQDPRAAARLLGQLTEQTRADIGEIRRLVDGLRPPALDQLGLVSALRQRAEEHNAAVRLGQGRSRMLWTVEADEHLEPLPAAVEVAAYRIVVEAVNNALRHSRADSCAVRLRRRSGTLEVEVRDTGNGLGTSSDGVGLGSMRERAEELGGSCSISSTPGEGTRVLVSLPLTTGAAGESAR